MDSRAVVQYVNAYEAVARYNCWYFADCKNVATVA